MAEQVAYIKAEQLQTFLGELFAQTGMPSADATYMAQTLIKTNLWGIDSHGVLRTGVYFERLVKKAINPTPEFRFKGHEAPALCVMDADGAAGCIAARRATEKVIELAKQYGIAAVGVMNSNHFGAAALYTAEIAACGMAGIAMTNVLPLLTAPGARGKVVGNNPLSIGIPTYLDFPFLLDMSLSVVAGGKLRLASKKGEKIPFGWATDDQGNDTDDPDKAIDGFLLPVGGFKGLGLAYAVDILCGVITGGVFADQMRSMYSHPDEPSLTGHMVIAFNLDAIITREEMAARMKTYHDYIRSRPMNKEGEHLVFPGELEYLRSKGREKTGIPVPLETLAELERFKAQYNLQSELSVIGGGGQA